MKKICIVGLLGLAATHAGFASQAPTPKSTGLTGLVAASLKKGAPGKATEAIFIIPHLDDHVRSGGPQWSQPKPQPVPWEPRRPYPQNPIPMPKLPNPGTRPPFHPGYPIKPQPEQPIWRPGIDHFEVVPLIWYPDQDHGKIVPCKRPASEKPAAKFEPPCKRQHTT